jgi:hypothetical protein
MTKNLLLTLVGGLGLLAVQASAGEADGKAPGAGVHTAWAAALAGVGHPAVPSAGIAGQASHPDLDVYLSFHDQTMAVGPRALRLPWPTFEQQAN